jgi:copper transport protein
VRPRPRTAPAVLLVAFLCTVFSVWSAAPAEAHTELVQWGFVTDATTSPTTLLLRFSEPIDSEFLTVGVVDMQGERLPAGSVRIDPQHRTDGLVDLPPLANGTYSVGWWTRALDGDTSTGSFLVGVGTVLEPLALLPPVGARDPATQPATLLSGTVWNALLHWLTYLAAALLVGTAAFVLLTLRSRPPARAPGLPGRYRALAVTGAGLFLFTSLLMMIMQAGLVRYSLLQPVTSSAPTPLEPSSLSHTPPYQAVLEILHGYSGRVWLARMLLGIVALVLAVKLEPTARRPVARWAATLGVSAAALLTVSLTAHAAVVPQAAWAVPVDWAHMVVMTTWIGGMLPLMMAMRAFPSREVAEIVRRFSTQALAAVGFLAATGLLAAFVHVRSVRLLLPTTYGIALIVKVVLFAVLVGFGALHRRIFIPRLTAETPSGRTSLGRVLPWELGVGCALLLAVSTMASLGTSAAVWPGHQALGVAQTVQLEGASAILRAVPGRTGENAVALDLLDRRAGPATVPSSVTLTIAGRTLELTPAGSLSPGTTQRFLAASLEQLPEGSLETTFRVVRPEYPDLTGVAHAKLAPALP